MTSQRAYRQSISASEALQKIKEGAGIQFDPNLVQIFESILPQAQEEIEEYERQEKLLSKEANI